MNLLHIRAGRHVTLAALGATLWLGNTAPALAQATSDSGAANPAHTFSANLALASDYRYRGLAQSNGRPAIQGGFDYSHASGFYLGNWNSSISWLGDSHPDVSAPIEMDFYGGYRHAFGDSGWSTDIGVLQYYYPGSYPDRYTSPDTTELYAGVGYGPVTLKYTYAPTNLFGLADSRHSWYADLSANVPLGFWGLTLNAHVGYQKVQVADASYADWKLGLTKDLGHGFALALAYIDTNAERAVYTSAKGRYLGRATVWGSLSKTF